MECLEKKKRLQFNPEKQLHSQGKEPGVPRRRMGGLFDPYLKPPCLARFCPKIETLG